MKQYRETKRLYTNQRKDYNKCLKKCEGISISMNEYLYSIHVGSRHQRYVKAVQHKDIFNRGRLRHGLHLPSTENGEKFLRFHIWLNVNVVE